jgi:hypothetical protein
MGPLERLITFLYVAQFFKSMETMLTTLFPLLINGAFPF